MDVLEDLALSSGYSLEGKFDLSSMNPFQIDNLKKELGRLAKEVGYKLLLVQKQNQLITFSRYTKL